MTTVPQPAALSSDGTVSYTLLLVVNARRAAARAGADLQPVAAAATAAYRASGNHHDGTRAIRAAVAGQRA